MKKLFPGRNLVLLCVLALALAACNWFERHETVVYRGDAAHRGVFSGDGPGNLTSPVWTFKTGYAITGSPVSLDGTLFVGSMDRKLYAVDPGSEIGRAHV